MLILLYHVIVVPHCLLSFITFHVVVKLPRCKIYSLTILFEGLSHELYLMRDPTKDYANTL